jgi:hypothetical protein
VKGGTEDLVGSGHLPSMERRAFDFELGYHADEVSGHRLKAPLHRATVSAMTDGFTDAAAAAVSALTDALKDEEAAKANEEAKEKERVAATIADSVRVIEGKLRREMEKRIAPEWHTELQNLMRVLSVLRTLSVENQRTRRTAYGPYIPLLPQWRINVLYGFLHALLDDVPEELETLVSMRHQLMWELRQIVEELETRVPDGDASFLASVRVDLAEVAALGVLRDAAAVSEAKTAQQEAAGDVAESELAKWFAAYEERQNREGYLWFGGAVLLIAATVIVAFMVLGHTGQAFDWVSLASHLLIALPCLGLGAYCARESSRHRELAQWARRLAVQLKSVSAYTARLENGPRMTLLAQFGTYVFGHHPMGKDDNQVQPIPAELWKALADVIRSRGGAND